ncbi:hypothetical protein, partial [Megamonas funiformis]|uniref:hypothetical protein n=1 Tax=Megamonas funiformis TaxID=437897 RepID=UPI001956CE9F
GHQPSLERYSKTCYFSRQVSFVSKNPLPLGMGSMSKDKYLSFAPYNITKEMIKEAIDMLEALKHKKTF